MGKGPSNPASEILANMSQNLYNESAGVRGGTFSQGEEILKSGGASMLIPLISKAIEGSKLALNKTMTTLNDRMGRMAGTPFGLRALTETKLGGEMNIANIAPQMNMELFKNILGFTGGVTSTAIGGMGTATSAEATRIASENEATARILSAAMPKTSIGYSAGGG